MRKLKGFLRKYLRLIVFSFLHSILWVLLTYYWMNMSFEFADDMVKVARVNQIVQYLLLDQNDQLADKIKKELVLVNCSYDKMLVPYEDDRGSGTRAVINRQLLADILKLIRAAGPQMVIFDIFLDNPSELDSILYAELKQVSPLIMSSDLNPDGSMRRPRGGFNYGRAQYETTVGTFLKYRLLDQDSIKYVPSLMYEVTTHDTLHTLGPLAHSERAWWMNSFIVDLSIRKSHIENNEVVMWNLGEVLKYTPAEEIKTLTAGKIVILGDFYEFDNHDTLLGVQPGPLIIVNTYLGLLKGVPRIAVSGFLLVFALYFATTLYILRLKSYREKLHGRPLLQGRVMKFILKYLSYIVIFSVYTVLLYIITGKHFELLIFAIYFNVLEFVVSKYQGWFDRILVPEKQATITA